MPFEIEFDLGFQHLTASVEKYANQIPGYYAVTVNDQRIKDDFGVIIHFETTDSTNLTIPATNSVSEQELYSSIANAIMMHENFNPE